MTTKPDLKQVQEFVKEKCGGNFPDTIFPNLYYIENISVEMTNTSRLLILFSVHAEEKSNLYPFIEQFMWQIAKPFDLQNELCQFTIGRLLGYKKEGKTNE